MSDSTVYLSRCGVADEGRGIKEGDGRRLLESRTIGFHRLSRASVEGELACGQVGHIGLASGVANLVQNQCGKIEDGSQRAGTAKGTVMGR